MTDVALRLSIGLKSFGVRAVESHISQKTSEIWGTPVRGRAKVLGRSPSLPTPEFSRRGYLALVSAYEAVSDYSRTLDPFLSRLGARVKDHAKLVRGQEISGATCPEGPQNSRMCPRYEMR
jgi:hypothetical protein